MNHVHITPFSTFLADIQHSIYESESLKNLPVGSGPKGLRFRKGSTGIPREIDPSYIENLFEALYEALVDKVIGDWQLLRDINEETYVLEFSPTVYPVRNSTLTIDVYPFYRNTEISLSYQTISDELGTLGINYYEGFLTGDINVDTRALCDIIAEKISKIHVIDVVSTLIETNAASSWIYFDDETSVKNILAFYVSSVDKDIVNGKRRRATPGVPGISIIQRLLYAMDFDPEYERYDDIVVELVKTVILNGADPFAGFSGAEEIIEFFNGDIDWMPADLKRQLQLAKRSKKMFGV